MITPKLNNLTHIDDEPTVLASFDMGVVRLKNDMEAIIVEYEGLKGEKGALMLTLDAAIHLRDGLTNTMGLMDKPEF